MCSSLKCGSGPLTLEHLWKPTRLVFEKHLVLLKCEQVQRLYSTLVVHVSSYVKTNVHASHATVSSHWSYSTELSSNSLAATSCAHLPRPLKRASCHGLRARSAQHWAMSMYICVLVSFSFWRGEAFKLCPCHEPNPVDLIPVGPSWRPSRSPWCNWSVCRDCVLSLLNVRWNSSCSHYWSTYLMYVNNVFLKKSDWMLVLWDHRCERSLTREPRGPGLRLSSIKALDGASPPWRWQVMFSGLQLVFFLLPLLLLLLLLCFVMLSLFHISWAFPLWSFSSHSQMADSVAILMSDAWWE